ncbi:MAG: sodium:solute symporter family protein [Calditrichaeota bacterium]|nr:sodium:solute symporter family protein [Calditrichota bacterium]MCB9365599.1 sodium:solute symporter family protein [Calditrichota bacterium]
MSDQLIQWSVIGAYVTFIFVKGVLKSRNIHSTDDYLVAGRNVSWWLLFATMGATVIGGGYSIGATAKTYEYGLLWVLISLGGYLHFVFSGMVVAPKFREAELYTVAGYFGHRFGERPRFVAMLLSLLFSLFIIAAQMAAFGSILATLMPGAAEGGFDVRYAILIGGLIVIVYSTAGGLLAVIYTDLYQFIILFLGFGITLAVCAPDLIASWGTVQEKLPAAWFAVEGGKGWSFLITTFLAFLLGETFAPGYATRYCIGRDVKHTQRGIAGVGIVLALTFPVVLFFIAMYGRLHFPDVDPQSTLSLVVKSLHNPWIAGLIIAALLSAVMSSADSALNSCTAIFVKDVFEHQFKSKFASDAESLKWARRLTVAVGISATLVAFFWPDIIGLLLFTYHLWAPGVILPVVYGTLSKHRSPALNAAMFVTMLISVGATLLYRMTDYAETFDPAVFGVVVSILVFVIARRLVR